MITDILGTGLRDNLQARRLRPDGTAERLQPIDGDIPMSSQDWLLAHWNSDMKPVGPIPSRRSFP